MSISWNSTFLAFNKSLVNDEVFYSIKEYIKQFKSRFNNDLDISMLDDYYMSSCEYDKFIVSEESISEIIPLRKIIKKFNFEVGLDYIMINKPYNFSNLVSPFKSSYSIKLTPVAFKKILLLSGNSNYMNYFIFLETVIQNYEEYQKLFNRKTLIEAQQKIKFLERKIRKDCIKKNLEKETGLEMEFNFDFSSDSS